MRGSSGDGHSCALPRPLQAAAARQPSNASRPPDSVVDILGLPLCHGGQVLLSFPLPLETAGTTSDNSASIMTAADILCCVDAALAGVSATGTILTHAEALVRALSSRWVIM